jgi:hypothetical protein
MCVRVRVHGPPPPAPGAWPARLVVPPSRVPPPRNPQEYFEFEGPDSRTGKARGLKPETQAAISSWLQENK